jgi:two-component system response regulator AtoC
MTSGALAAMHAYDYPGNVRELRNIVERAIILAQGPEITERDVILSDPPSGKNEPAAFFTVALGSEGTAPNLEVVERAYVVRVLEHLHGKRMAAAQALGISYPTFLKRLRELGLSPD